MLEEICPLMKQFEKLLPDKNCPWKRVADLDRVKVAMTQESYTTATVNKCQVFPGLNAVEDDGSP
jgi:hypothetical protein